MWTPSARLGQRHRRRRPELTCLVVLFVFLFAFRQTIDLGPERVEIDASPARRASRRRQRGRRGAGRRRQAHGLRACAPRGRRSSSRSHRTRRTPGACRSCRGGWSANGSARQADEMTLSPPTGDQGAIRARVAEPPGFAAFTRTLAAEPLCGRRDCDLVGEDVALTQSDAWARRRTRARSVHGPRGQREKRGDDPRTRHPARNVRLPRARGLGGAASRKTRPRRRRRPRSRRDGPRRTVDSHHRRQRRPLRQHEGFRPIVTEVPETAVRLRVRGRWKPRGPNPHVRTRLQRRSVLRFDALARRERIPAERVAEEVRIRSAGAPSMRMM